MTEPKHNRTEEMQEFFDQVKPKKYMRGTPDNVHTDQRALDYTLYNAVAIDQKISTVLEKMHVKPMTQRDEAWFEWLDDTLRDLFLHTSDIIECWDFLNKKYGAEENEIEESETEETEESVSHVSEDYQGDI